MADVKEEAKTVEVAIAELTTHKDKVYFPGQANLSEKEAGMFAAKQEAAQEAEVPEAEETVTSKKKK